jgi:CheY-like chemotaxis protein
VDIVFADVQMPIMTGPEVIIYIREKVSHPCYPLNHALPSTGPADDAPVPRVRDRRPGPRRAYKEADDSVCLREPLGRRPM